MPASTSVEPGGVPPRRSRRGGRSEVVVEHLGPRILGPSLPAHLISKLHVRALEGRILSRLFQRQLSRRARCLKYSQTWSTIEIAATPAIPMNASTQPIILVSLLEVLNNRMRPLADSKLQQGKLTFAAEHSLKQADASPASRSKIRSQPLALLLGRQCEDLFSHRNILAGLSPAVLGCGIIRR